MNRLACFRDRSAQEDYTCCHAEAEAADPTCCLTQSHDADTGPTSPSSDRKTPGAWPGCHSSTNISVIGKDRLVGLVVKASASRAEDPGFESACDGIFSRSSHTSDSKIGTPVATLTGAWRYRISTGTGWPGVSIL